MILRVYRNLRTSCWSLLDPRTRRVVDHREELVLVDVRLEVSEKTRQWVINQQRRTVHAYARGTLAELPVRSGGVPPRYNPYELGSFTVEGEPITWAARVDFRRDGAFIVEGA